MIDISFIEVDLVEADGVQYKIKRCWTYIWVGISRVGLWLRDHALLSRTVALMSPIIYSPSMNLLYITLCAHCITYSSIIVCNNHFEYLYVNSMPSYASIKLMRAGDERMIISLEMYYMLAISLLVTPSSSKWQLFEGHIEFFYMLTLIIVIPMWLTYKNSSWLQLIGYKSCRSGPSRMVYSHDLIFTVLRLFQLLLHSVPDV